MATMVFMPWMVFADGETEGTEGEGSSSSEKAKIEEEAAAAKYTGEDGFVFNTCNTIGLPPIKYTVDDDAEYDANEETAVVSAFMEDYEYLYSDNIGDSKCGEINLFTTSLEMADCAAEGKVVSEISESFAGDTKLGDEARVVTVYKSSCCMIVKEHIKVVNEQEVITYECVDLRSVYYDDPSHCSDDEACQKRQWIIGDSGASIIKIYVKQIYIWAAGTIGFISVIIIVVNGIRISVSGASGDITQAKERILQSISGLVLLFLSGLLLYTINPTFFS